MLLSFQRAILMQSRVTRPITVATMIEVSAIAILFIGRRLVARVDGSHGGVRRVRGRSGAEHGVPGVPTCGRVLPSDLTQQATRTCFRTRWRSSLFGHPCLCLELEWLIRTKRAAGHPRDFETVAELLASREERRQPGTD